MDIKSLLLLCIEKSASDLHITDNEPPILRIDGVLHRTELPSLNKQDMLDLLGIELGPVRLKCALLSLKVLKAGVYGLGEATEELVE